MGIAWGSLRVRVGRSVLTLITIAMAIAFLTDVVSSRVWTPAGAGPAGSAARTVWLLSLSLLVCVVGISNAMLMSVMERFREIGTMKCLGALDSFILRLFFFESIFLGVAGSAAGSAIGLGLSFLQLLVKYGATGLPAHMGRDALCIGAGAIFVGTVMTALAAAYPSWKAARMEPVEAMRVEV